MRHVHDWTMIGEGWERSDDPVERGRMDWCPDCGAIKDCNDKIVLPRYHLQIERLWDDMRALDPSKARAALDAARA